MGKRIINTGKPGLPRDIRRPASPSTADARISSATDLRLALLFSILASIAIKKQTFGQGILVTFLDFLRKKIPGEDYWVGVSTVILVVNDTGFRRFLGFTFFCILLSRCIIEQGWARTNG